MTINSKDLRIKALKSYLASEKNVDINKRYEWLLLNTNNQRGKVFTQIELLKNFNTLFELSESIVVFNDYFLNNIKYDFIALSIERNDELASKNYLSNKINMYLEYIDKEEASYLQPIARYHKTKSDHTKDGKEIAKTIAITQKVIKIGGLHELCKECNKTISHYDKMRYFAKKHNIDTKKCGIIYNYHTKKYDVVFLEYGL